ncbi:MAG: 1-(5-phosphoribosyl)-5-[(5-phosphoribosylamino)methylideneamino]imidazole-4-carboxamide isomerase [Cyclobacteriaceae bacterium]|nr:1-(5-phosphoribosyl)-5-[(5-phosphoribosylamino)methylideneamino]imidazole-4-carboxamide isomerase [Cyclobacteriaceae bacterium]
MKIIPAIDIINGKCVRLTKGDYNTEKMYNENPLEVAKSFEDHGIKYLHLVDLDGAKASSIVNGKVLESIANNTNLTIDFGGGIKTTSAVKQAFELGATQITAGSIAAKNSALVFDWVREFGPDKIILGADVNNRKIAINGWQESTKIELDDYIKSYMAKGIQSVICTDISKDGMLKGSSIELYQQLRTKFPALKLIASGGVTSIQELDKLKAIGLEGAIIGKAIYENKITLKQLEEYVN